MHLTVLEEPAELLPQATSSTVNTMQSGLRRIMGVFPLGPAA